MLSFRLQSATRAKTLSCWPRWKSCARRTPTFWRHSLGPPIFLPRTAQGSEGRATLRGAFMVIATELLRESVGDVECLLVVLRGLLFDVVDRVAEKVVGGDSVDAHEVFVGVVDGLEQWVVVVDEFGVGGELA